MEWNKGYSASYKVREVDPVTWHDRGEIPIKTGTVKRTFTGLRNSATLTTLEPLDGVEKWIRIYMDVRQSGAYAREAVFTGLAQSPKRKAYATRFDRTLDCYSVLKPADDVILPRGYYILAGTDAGDAIRTLLSVIPAPVVIAENAPKIKTSIVAEDDETHLSMVNKVIESINWRVDIEGDGTVNILPYSALPVAKFDAVEYDVVEVPIDINEDWFSAPNCYRAVCDGIEGVAKDTDENSPLSIPNRGREVWQTESGVSLSGNETIEQYAERQLKAAQRVRKKLSYDRRFIPYVRVGSVVNLHFPQQEIDGLYLVTGQSIKLGHGARTAEDAEEL